MQVDKNPHHLSIEKKREKNVEGKRNERKRENMENWKTRKNKRG